MADSVTPSHTKHIEDDDAEMAGSSLPTLCGDDNNDDDVVCWRNRYS